MRGKSEQVIVERFKTVKLAGKAIDLNPITHVKTHSDKLNIRIEPGFPFSNLHAVIAPYLDALDEAVELEIEQKIQASPALNAQNKINGVRNIVCVASGKGGVGKSTTSVNVALALAQEGAKVGLLDADIYGPSQSHMLGCDNQKPKTLNGNTLIPLQAHGIELISMGNLVNENTPMIWRGPMVSGALQQLLNQTKWDDLDYLVVDMPPGTGDIQLTLSQSVPVTGALVVTTPQDIALLDAKKAIEMFRKVNVPVLGVVENMALHTCSNCGHQEAIFGEHGGEKLAQEYGVPVIGRLPLKLEIREQTDSGNPPVAADPESEVSKIYKQIAQRIGIDIWLNGLQSRSGSPNISIIDD